MTTDAGLIKTEDSGKYFSSSPDECQRWLKSTGKTCTMFTIKKGQDGVFDGCRCCESDEYTFNPKYKTYKVEENCLTSTTDPKPSVDF